MKRIVAIFSVLGIVGCGASGGGEPAGFDPHIGPGGAFPLDQLLGDPDVTVAKVVLKTKRTTDQVVTTYDGSTDSDVPVKCGTNADCGAYPDASCKAGVCTQPVTSTAVFYVKNFDAVTSTSTFPVPCDGNDYFVEAYGANAARSVRVVYTASLKLASDCTVTTAPAWAEAPDTALPAFDFPEFIYVGLGAPYDRYTLAVPNPSYPWSARDWTFTCGQQAGPGNLPVAAPIAGKTTFPAPGTSSDITCTGVFPLDSSIRLPGEPLWQLQKQASKTPTNTGGIGLPP